jgi:uncharacterized protein
MVTTLNCPHCAKLTEWENNQYRPFCSERCQLIDLGAWASDAYQIPTEDAPQSNDDEY